MSSKSVFVVGGKIPFSKNIKQVLESVLPGLKSKTEVRSKMFSINRNKN